MGLKSRDQLKDVLFLFAFDVPLADLYVLGHYLLHKYKSLCYILTLAPAQKCYSKVIHRKEVTHSNGQ